MIKGWFDTSCNTIQHSIYLICRSRFIRSRSHFERIRRLAVSLKSQKKNPEGEFAGKLENCNWHKIYTPEKFWQVNCICVSAVCLSYTDQKWQFENISVHTNS